MVNFGQFEIIETSAYLGTLIDTVSKGGFWNCGDCLIKHLLWTILDAFRANGVGSDIALQKLMDKNIE